jgi:hypothetical protein
MRRLIELMRSEDERVAAVACNAILDRALGKAVAQQPETDSLANRIAKMTADERARDALELMARARRRLGQYRRTIEHEGSGEPAPEPAPGPESQEWPAVGYEGLKIPGAGCARALFSTVPEPAEFFGCDRPRAGFRDPHGEIRGLTVEEYINRLGQDLLPLAERCRLVMRVALAALEATRGAPSQAVERSRPARISVVFEPPPPGW